MAGTIDLDELGGGGSGNFLTMLAHPAQVNPLGAIGGAATVANQVWAARQQQANQLAGQASQDAIDRTTGEYSPSKYGQNLVAAGPGAALAARVGLESNQSLSDAILKQKFDKLKFINAEAGALAIKGNVSDADIHGIFERGVASGLLTPAEVERQLATVPADPAGRLRWAEQHRDSTLAPLAQVEQRYGTTFRENTGGQIVGGVQASPRGGGGLGAGGGALGTTLSPAEVVSRGIEFAADERYVREHPGTALGATVRLPGTTLLEQQGLGRYIPPGAKDTTTGGGGGEGLPSNLRNPANRTTTQPPAAPASAGGGGAAQPVVPPGVVPGPPATPGGAPVTTPYTAPQRPVLQNLPPPAVTPPPATATPPPVVVPPPAVTPPRPTLPPNAPTAALQGGVPVASTNFLVPQTGAASPPGPAVPGDVNAIMQGMQNARAAPSAGTRVADNAVSYGPGVQEVGQWKASTDRLAADDTMSANFAQTQFPLVQGLNQYGKGTVTGPGADFWNRVGGYIRTPLQKIGIDVGSLATATERYDSLNKWLGQIVASTPFAAGSDARLSQVLNGSANTHINQAAGEDMLKAGLVLQRMNVAANSQWHAMTPEQQSQHGGLYLNFLRGYSNTVDPRAFGVDMYNPTQKAELAKALRAGSEADAKRFNDSLAIANGLGAQPALP